MSKLSAWSRNTYNGVMYTYIMCASPVHDICVIDKGSAWGPAFAGTHASGRAGKELELFHPTHTRIEIERNAKSLIRK